MKEVMGSVELIAQGYEWMCPECDELNSEIEVTAEVMCASCGLHFEVEDHEHAYG